MMAGSFQRGEQGAPVSDGQSVVVTGAASGFGALLARAFHGAGYRVAVTDVDAAAAADLARELDPEGRTAVAGKLDIESADDFRRVLEKAASKWGAVEVLVNNAAVTMAQPVMDIAPADFNSVMNVNAGGIFAGSQVFGRYFKQRGYGRIVNLASLAGQNGGTATGAHYAASKGAILTLTKVFARELSPFGVTVNCVAPGPMDMPQVHALMTKDKMPGFLANIPVGRLIDPVFVASVVILLASPNAGSVSGACWDVNGGILMR